MIRALWLLVWLATPAHAVTCADVTFDDTSFTTCTVDLTQDALELFHSDDAGQVLGSFSAVADTHPDRDLIFAMNAGMYHSDRRPVGLFIKNFTQTARIQPNDGPGNFGLLPNGVLCITDDSAHVIETLRYLAEAPTCRDATQSGPMLVIDQALHPRFLPNSDSRFIRNGVGTSHDGKTAIFAISNVPVNFHTFGRLFRDYLNLPQALYFDGKVSRLHAPALGRSDIGLPLGPIIGVTSAAR